MKWRPLDFRTVDEVIAELDRLQSAGCSPAGNWNLAQACNHLAIFVRGSLDGFTGSRPPWFARLLAPLFMRWMLKNRRMPEGVRIADELRPSDGLDEAHEVVELKQLLRRFETNKGPLHQSPFAGDISAETWREMHLIPCAHHLSFLHPAMPEGAANR